MPEIVSLCKGISCVLNGSEEVDDILEQFIQDNNLEKELSVVDSCCKGICSVGPNANLLNSSKKFNRLTKDNLKEFLETIVTYLDENKK